MFNHVLYNPPNYSSNDKHRMATNQVGDDPQRRIDELRRLLSRRSMSTEELLTTLKVSQPTLSRTIQAVPGVTLFRVHGVRTPRYGLIRALPGGIAGSQKVYRIDETGAVRAEGALALLAGGESFVTAGGAGVLYEGLPPQLAFAAPSGYLGRQAAHAFAEELQLPENLRDWSDDHRAAYVVARGWNLPGNLVYGDNSLAHALDFRRTVPTSASARLDTYAGMTDALLNTTIGSSAGGEQPKFLALTEDNGHVIVKYARENPRMSELLNLEHIALESLAGAGVRAAKSRVFVHAGVTYLEVERFDRVGLHGRLGLISAGAFDDEHFGKRDSWSAFAERCVEGRILQSSQADSLHIMAAFSELIGNSDRHFENVSLMLDGEGRVSDVAPAYDILPMKYAPTAAGTPPLAVITPKLGPIGGRAEVWTIAYRAAREFWSRAGSEKSLSADMQALATKNLAVATDFVAPLVASVPVASVSATSAPARRPRPR